MAKLDQTFGCKDPHKNLSKRKMRDCMAKQRAGGESLFDLNDDFNKLFRQDSKVVYQNSVNPYLWNAGLEVTKKYPLKIADNQGGFIETEWIRDSNNMNQRCLIKIQITSQELVTTGVKSSFLCETNQGDEWITDNVEYIKESNQITLKILDIAGNLSKASL
tara:strand:+ start:545 stop:1030 length:486 start_codon:yes stop_codon:yes gene_type:complete